jgi:S-adenosyl-L-methionine hydrolase (adenosine-forming)
MPVTRPLVTLLTDFGTADGYVGEVKGALLAAVPEANIVDISHDVPPQDVESGRLALARYWRRFPPGTVHLVVVDPGVGANRAAIAVESAGYALVGPDNGVLSPALLVPGARAVTLAVPVHAAPTFHGRDVFAPAAAALARGDQVSALGAPHDHALVLRTPEPERWGDGTLQGEVIAIDHFGNAVTNCLGLRGGTLEVGGVVLPVMRAYADVPPGTLVAVTGSNGLLEIAERDGSAARRLGLTRGTPVLFRAHARASTGAGEA